MKIQLPIIKNFDEITNSKLKKDALEILEVGYESILTEKIFLSKISLQENFLFISDKKFDLNNYKKIFVIAIGKCAISSATALEKILGDKITEGIVFDVEKSNFKKMISEKGTHPLQSEKNVYITENIIELLKKATKKDLILTVISGGGSALLSAPFKTDYDNQRLFISELMRKGATITEINTVRKHISDIKGGQFAQLAYPSTVVSLILSDVPGSDLSVIASGPTVMDQTTIADAKDIIEKYELKISSERFLGGFKETPKKDKFFKKVTNILLVSNLVALEEMKKKAESLGYNTYIESEKLEGEARVLGKKLISKEYLPSSCHLWGGETTVRVFGNDGIGGRNQEFVLGALPFIEENMIIIGAASDGWDNSDMAGAIGDFRLFDFSLQKNIDYKKYLNENNSYNFFKQLGGHIQTGRTGANVADFYIIIKGKDSLEKEDGF